MLRISADDYHRYERRERAALGISPLNPEANHLDVLTQHLGHLRRGEPVLKPVYDHRDGTLGRPEYVRPTAFLVVEGLLNFHTEPPRATHDVRVFLAPPEDLVRAWKLKRNCTRRRYTTDELLHELDHRERDAERFIRPQRLHADIVVSFHPGEDTGPSHLDADVLLRDTLSHSGLSPLLSADDGGRTLRRRERDLLLSIPGDIAPAHAAELEGAVWARMSFVSHLRVRRLGEFTVGTDVCRSDSLALVQLIVPYHLVWARASVRRGREPDRHAASDPTGADSALRA